MPTLGQAARQRINGRVLAIDAFEFKRVPMEMVFLGKPIRQRLDNGRLPGRFAENRQVFGADFAEPKKRITRPSQGECPTNQGQDHGLASSWSVSTLSRSPGPR